MTDTPQAESFTDFKNSFSYGSRNDLNFKFLKGLSDEDAADFLQALLWQLSDTINDGHLDPLIDLVYRYQVQAYAGPAGQWTYDDGPFTPLAKPLADSRLVLLTSSGHFVEGDDPEPFGVKNMTQAEAGRRIGDFLKVAPQLSAIPVDTPPEKLQVRHGGYDIRAAQADPNVALPLKPLRTLVEAGVIGELAPHAYSFVGACAQTPLLKKTAPQWANLFKEQGVDVALLVPVWPVCHVSVGHTARTLEGAGIPTVVVGVRAFRDRMTAMTLPRLVVTPHLMGRPVGLPNDRQRQIAVIRTALDLLKNATQGGVVVEVAGK